MIITNVVSLKAEWAQPFTKEYTRNEDFHLFKNSHAWVPVPFMEVTGNFTSGTVLNYFPFIELPYKVPLLFTLLFFRVR